jgi:hypothetical protein
VVADVITRGESCTFSCHVCYTNLEINDDVWFEHTEPNQTP